MQPAEPPERSNVTHYPHKPSPGILAEEGVQSSNGPLRHGNEATAAIASSSRATTPGRRGQLSAGRSIAQTSDLIARLAYGRGVRPYLVSADHGAML
jgi:hypothetical protein